MKLKSPKSALSAIPHLLDCVLFSANEYTHLIFYELVNMKIFIINMIRSTERRRRMEQQLNKQNLSFEFIEAVDGHAMSEVEKKQHSRKTNYAFLPGEIGCALSHQKIYSKMIDENINKALILEDDVILPDNLNEILKSLNVNNKKPMVVLLSRVNKYIKKPTTHLIDEYAIHKTQQATTAHSYIVNKKAASTLLKNLYPIWMTADKWSLFEDMSLIKVFSIIPHPIHLSDESKKSTINVSIEKSTLHNMKKETWGKIMSNRTIGTKIKHRFRRAITPIFNKIVNQGKG